jgi:hypothetical protein
MTRRACPAIVIPVTIVSEANQREHHMARKLEQQRIALLTLNAAVSPARARALKPVGVWLTRIIPTRGRSFDMDNLAGSFKHVQDAVAMWLGIDDGKLKWSYAQERGHVAGVRVEVWTNA